MDDCQIRRLMTQSGCGGTLTPAVRRFAQACAAAGADAERDRLEALGGAYLPLTRGQKLADAGFVPRPSLRAMEMRAALELIAARTWNRGREACRELAAEALGLDDGLPDADAGPRGPE